MSTAHDPPTTPELKVFLDEPSTRPSSSPPPTVWMNDFAGSWWCNDRFFEVYQGCFIPRSPNSRDSSHSSPTPFEHHRETMEPTNARPAPQLYACSTAPMYNDNTVYHDTVERYPPTGSRMSDSECATQFEGDDHIDWFIPPMVFEPIDP
ncbi:hypothetical protein GSI_13157 [Ganoderma sinense ZZ0214-1]|uniref:Uncharacterized protein n=1 Tax=Ganoderma sinense ZZ0214-1 TaxID=1077348 RepID=A0A2G8RVA8_9APHY|nr:hypothetical protein GSI_13157 [Ganoderma sinense ZZ0214-1]